MSNRRQVLALLAATGATSIAGCGSQGADTAYPESEPQAAEIKIAPEDVGGSGAFGYGVEMSADGSTAVIGAPYENESTGAAYVYSRPTGEWEQQARLVAEDQEGIVRFGRSTGVSADGSTIVIRAPENESQTGTVGGPVYVFARSTGEWERQAKFTAFDGDDSDGFGRAIDMTPDGNTVMVGATGSRRSPDGESGTVYVFVRSSSGDWTQQTTITAPDGDSGDAFGSGVTVARDGSTVVIGAVGYEDPHGKYAGSAYIFTEMDGEWSQQTKLTAADGDSNDGFGLKVGISADGSTVLVAARNDEDPNGLLAGSVYAFTQSNGDWQQQAKLLPNDDGGLFGDSIGLSADGNTAVIGASENAVASGPFGGAVYLFRQSGSEWSQQRRIAAPDGDEDDVFGSSVGLSADGTVVVVGAPLDEDPNGDSGGSAYILPTDGDGNLL